MAVRRIHRIVKVSMRDGGRVHIRRGVPHKTTYARNIEPRYWLFLYRNLWR